MKTLILISFLLCSIFTGFAQEVTELEEARIVVLPKQLPSSNSNEYRFQVNEKYAGEFSKDAVSFMLDNFDMPGFIATVMDKEYDTYLLTFSSSNGYLSADFDKEGQLVSTNQRFKDVVLPLDVRRNLYVQNKGWTMTKNTYKAKGEEDRLDEEMYRIKMERGNDKKIVKIDPKVLNASEVASN